jgi:adenosylcobyric acid synthase
MLGESIDDPDGVESAVSREPGLGLLPLRTLFRRDKLTARVSARLTSDSLLGAAGPTLVAGYEIHMGIVEPTRSFAALFTIVSRNGEPCDIADGAINGAVAGTMLHGVLNEDAVRGSLLSGLRRRRGLRVPVTGGAPFNVHDEYDRLATVVRDALGDGARAFLPTAPAEFAAPSPKTD